MADRSVLVRLRANVSDFNRNIATSSAAVGTLESRLRSADKEGGASIDRLSGRLRVLAEVGAVAGQALGPLGGVAIAGVAGLASQLGFAAVAGGVLIGSLQGVGDALGAMNKAQLDPTNKNLEAAEDALKRLSPAARDFAEAAFDLKPALVAIRDMGAESLMPGLTESLDNLERLGPRVAGIFEAIAGTGGDVAAETTESFSSDRWADFFTFIEREAPDAITELATTVGDLTHGMAELWEAFTPLNDGFSSWLMGVADGFDQWATGLSATEGFAEFVDYIQTTGPQVAETLGALANAVLQIVEASAPLGGPVLAGFEAAANVIAAIADSDLGTPIMAGVAALSLLNRSLAVTAALSKTSLSSGLFSGFGKVTDGAKKQSGILRSLGSDLAVLGPQYSAVATRSERLALAAASTSKHFGAMTKGMGPAAGILGGLAIASSGAADGLGLTNTMSLALMGSLVPGGIVIGAAAGALLDMRSAGMGATEAIQGLDAAIQSGDMGALSQQIAAAKAELADITNLDFGGDIFDRIGFQWADTFGGPSMDEAREKIEASERALKEMAQAEGIANAEARGAALAFLTQTDANVDLGKWSGKSTEQIKAQADAIMESREQADKTARSFVGLGDSLNDSKVSLGQWMKDMASTADALNNFTTNSIRAGKRGLEDGLIRQLQAAGKEGALRMRQLANGTEAEIERANAAFRKGEKAIERYNNYKVPPKKVTADVSNAMAGFLGVDRYLSALDGRRATTYVDTVRTVTGPQGAAVFSQNARGDVKDRHNPEIATGGSWRVWAEPETQGESYIPHANDSRRPRAKRILEHTADKFGGQVVWFAEGGSTDRRGGKRKPRGGEFIRDNTDSLQAAIDRLTLAAEDQTRAVEDSTSRTEEWAQAMKQAGQNTLSTLGLDLWASSSSSPWRSGSGSGALFNLNKTNAGLGERIAIQQQLAGLGLRGDAFSELLTGTNADISGMIQGGQIPAYSAAFAEYQSLSATAQAQAGQIAYGAEYAASAAEQKAATAVARSMEAKLTQLTKQMERTTAALERIEREAPERTGDAVGSAISGPARNAARGNRNRGGKPQ